MRHACLTLEAYLWFNSSLHSAQLWSVVTMHMLCICPHITCMSCSFYWLVHSLRPNDSISYHGACSTLFQVMAFCLFSAKPLLGPMIWYLLALKNKINWNLNQIKTIFYQGIAFENIVCKILAIFWGLNVLNNYSNFVIYNWLFLFTCHQSSEKFFNNIATANTHQHGRKYSTWLCCH